MELFEKIFITGSNATFLDGELAKLLIGRYLSTKIYPLSFREILMINSIESYMDIVDQRAKVLGIVDNMMEYGSFVEIYNSPKQFRRDLIKSYYLLSNMTSLYSYSSLSKAVGITDVSSKEYLNFYNKNVECDFIAKKENKTIAVQVCYELNDRNRKREFNGLIKLPFGVDEKVLLTYNQNEDSRDDGVKVVPFWKYFSS